MLLRRIRPAQDFIGIPYAGPTHPSRASGFVHGRIAVVIRELTREREAPKSSGREKAVARLRYHQLALADPHQYLCICLSGVMGGRTIVVKLGHTRIDVLE